MSGGKGAERAAGQARTDELERQRRISYGTENIRKMFGRQFNDKYYEKLAADGTDTYTPEVGKQYEQSLRELQAALYRSGIQNSTAGVGMETDLKEKRELALQDVESSVRGTVNQRRQQVANAEMQAIGQLQSSADAGAAASQAQNLIDLNTQKESWSPLGQVFTDVTAGLATQAQLERDGNNRYNLGVSRMMGSRPNRYTTNVVT